MFGFGGTEKFLEQYGIHADLFRYMLVGGLIFTRLFILMMFVPYLGARPIPGRVRLAISLILVLFFYPPVSSMTPGPLPESAAILFTLFMKEALFAILLGFSAGMVFYGIQAAGNMIDNQRQLANAQIFNPGIGSQASLFGVFYYQLSIVIFLIIGGHRVLLRAIAHSFETVPLLGFPKIESGMEPVLEVLLHLASDTFIIALQLGAPVLVVIFIADIILGLTNRVAPMVNVFDLGFNIKGFVGGLLVYLSLPLVIYQMKVWFDQYMDSVLQLVKVFTR